MIQFPSVKSKCITLISEEGAGKGSLLQLMRRMMGSSKIFETTNASRDVWGEFNSPMANSFFVNLNELSKKDIKDAEGIIKGLITDSTLYINSKGVNQFPIDSYHRFFITTNKMEPINTSSTDRRNLIINSSNEKINNKPYFNKLHKLLSDDNVIKTCYEYFKSLEGCDNFNDIPIPVTEYQTNLKTLSKSPIELWLYEFTMRNSDKESVELLGSQTLQSFNYYCKQNNISYEIDSSKLIVRLSNLIQTGVENGRHTKKGNTKKFNIVELKKYFKIGVVEHMDDDDEDEVHEDYGYIGPTM
jgi:putative DNA primase/helicase